MLKAVIFDMDGVISDTQELHARVEEELLDEYGIKISSNVITERYAGIPDKEFFKNIFNNRGITNIKISSVIKEKWKRMMAIANENIDPISGVIEFIKELKKHNIKLGLASSSPLKFIDLVISKLNLKEKFDAITSIEEVEHGKPNPEIFLLTAKKLSTKPEECLVIEDGINGLIAAKKAKMKCIGLLKKRGNYPADMIINNFKELTIEKLQNL